MRKFNHQYKDYREERPKIAADQLQQFDIGWFDKIHQNIYNTGTIDGNLLFLVANFHLFLILRFFMASSGQPRLAIVVNTMRTAAVDLLHLFIVFGIIFFAYVISGHILFGRRMDQFATLEGSIAFAIGIVLMKEFDFQTLTQQDFITSCIWVYTFVVLVVLVLINIILAMIFDTYGEVRSHVLASDSLGFTFKRIFNQMRLAHVWMSNADILTTVRNVSETSDRVSMEELKEKMPDISNEQLLYLFNQSKSKVDSDMTVGNRNALAEAVASILMGIASLKDGVAVMDPRKRESDGKMGALISTPSGRKFEGQESFGSDKDVEDDSKLIVDAEGQPIWLKNALLPFLDQQKISFSRVYDDLYSVESQMIGRGIDAKIPKTGYPKPADPKKTNESLILPWSAQEQASYRQLNAVGEDLIRKDMIASPPPASGVPPCIGKTDRTVTG